MFTDSHTSFPGTDWRERDFGDTIAYLSIARLVIRVYPAHHKVSGEKATFFQKLYQNCKLEYMMHFIRCLFICINFACINVHGSIGSSWICVQMEETVCLIAWPLDGWGREPIHLLYLHVVHCQPFYWHWGARDDWGLGARKHHTGTLALSATISFSWPAFIHRVLLQDCIWAGKQSRLLIL